VTTILCAITSQGQNLIQNVVNNKIIIDQIQSNIKTVIKWDRYSSRINDETLTIKKKLGLCLCGIYVCSYLECGRPRSYSAKKMGNLYVTMRYLFSSRERIVLCTHMLHVVFIDLQGHAKGG